MKILMILLMVLAAFFFSLLHDTFLGQVGCWVIGGLGIFCIIITPKGTQPAVAANRNSGG